MTIKLDHCDLHNTDFIAHQCCQDCASDEINKLRAELAAANLKISGFEEMYSELFEHHEKIETELEEARASQEKAH